MKFMLSIFLIVCLLSTIRSYKHHHGPKKLLNLKKKVETKENCLNQDPYIVDIVSGFCNTACDTTMYTSKYSKCQMPFKGLTSSGKNDKTGYQRWDTFCKSCCKIENLTLDPNANKCIYSCNQQTSAIQCYRENISDHMREQLNNADELAKYKDAQEC